MTEKVRFMGGVYHGDGGGHHPVLEQEHPAMLSLELSDSILPSDSRGSCLCSCWWLRSRSRSVNC